MGQDAFLKDCLIDADNSLKAQSRSSADRFDDENSMTWEMMAFLGVNKDGWGVSAYRDTDVNPFITKAPIKAVDDPNYDAGMQRAIGKNPGMLMAHIRAGRRPDINNTHPFQYKQWSFMHNGSFGGKASAKLKREIEKNYLDRLGVTLKGQTDTEKIFYLLMGRLSDNERLPVAEQHSEQEVFKKTMREIFDLARKYDSARPIQKRFKKLTGIELSEDSSLRTSPSGNFVLSDGKRLMASCYGRKLYLGVRKPNDDSPAQIMLSSERIQPNKGAPRNQKIQWWEIPNEHMVVLDRTKNDVDVTITPF